MLNRQDLCKKGILIFVILALFVLPTFVYSADSACEDFEIGFTLGDDVGDHAEWFDGTDNDGSDVVAGIGINDSNGIAPGKWIFTWVEHEFNWNDPEFQRIELQMDFQTPEPPAQGVTPPPPYFYDDRLGFMITDSSNDSDNILGAELDSKDGGIVTYWRDSAGGTVKTPIVQLLDSEIEYDSWYRFSLAITKLPGGTAASLAVRLDELDPDGEPTGTFWDGSVPNTSTWPGGVPDTRYFTATRMWPAYKNYYNTGGAADNACFAINDCQGDFKNDNDVDGVDLADLALGYETLDLATFALEFGRTDCL